MIRWPALPRIAPMTPTIAGSSSATRILSGSTGAAPGSQGSIRLPVAGDPNEPVAALLTRQG